MVTKTQWKALIAAVALTIFLSACATVAQPSTDVEQLPATATPAAEVQTPQESDSTQQAAVEAETAEPSKAVAGDDLEEYDGATVGFTDEGYPFQGDPDAPVTISEFSDYACPFCGRHFQQTWPTLREDYVLAGDAKYVFRDFPIPSLHPTAPVAHVAARCAGEQGPALYWAMHDALFANQAQWTQLPDPSEYFSSVAESIGADMGAYATCIESGDTETWVQDSMAAGGALGFNGTPTFRFTAPFTDTAFTLVGAYPIDEFVAWTDALLSGEAPPQEVAAEAEPGELPYWANEEGLKPDQDRPGFTMAGDPYKGDPNAPLVVVEFSDFQCPSCADHALNVQPAIDKEFVDTGQVMWVFKNLPLPEHAQALAAAAAAECAGEQGKFWEMHDALLSSIDSWAVDAVDDALMRPASQIELDMDQFSTCLASRGALERVVSDLYDAQAVVGRTPSFIFLSDGIGIRLEGSRPVDQFAQIIRERLNALLPSE